MQLLKPFRQPVQPNNSHPLLKHLVGAFLFNSASIVSSDASYYRHSINKVGGNVSISPGRFGSALDLPGGGSYVAINPSPEALKCSGHPCKS